MDFWIKISLLNFLPLFWFCLQTSYLLLLLFFIWKVTSLPSTLLWTFYWNWILCRRFTLFINPHSLSFLLNLSIIVSRIIFYVVLTSLTVDFSLSFLWLTQFSRIKGTKESGTKHRVSCTCRLQWFLIPNVFTYTERSLHITILFVTSIPIFKTCLLNDPSLLHPYHSNQPYFFSNSYILSILFYYPFLLDLILFKRY